MHVCYFLDFLNEEKDKGSLYQELKRKVRIKRGLDGLHGAKFFLEGLKVLEAQSAESQMQDAPLLKFREILPKRTSYCKYI